MALSLPILCFWQHHAALRKGQWVAVRPYRGSCHLRSREIRESMSSRHAGTRALQLHFLLKSRLEQYGKPSRLLQGILTRTTPSSSAP